MTLIRKIAFTIAASGLMVAAPIASATSVAQLKELAPAACLKLTAEDTKALDIWETTNG